MRTVPKASAILGILLNLLILSISLLLFTRLGLLVDAASIFIILSAVMGCFFSTALLHDGEQTRTEAAHGEVREHDNDRTGKALGPEVA
jgi:flagellar motor component MotA